MKIYITEPHGRAHIKSIRKETPYYIRLVGEDDRRNLCRAYKIMRKHGISPMVSRYTLFQVVRCKEIEFAFTDDLFNKRKGVDSNV